MRRRESWNNIIEKFKHKLSDWKGKSLSFGGRLTLVKAVLGSMALYYFSLFRAPMSVINVLERLRSRFFSGGDDENKKNSSVKWEKVMNNFEMGRLDVGSLQASNLGLLGKW